MTQYGEALTCRPTFSWKAAAAARLTFTSRSKMDTITRALKENEYTTCRYIPVYIFIYTTSMTKRAKQASIAPIDTSSSKE